MMDAQSQHLSSFKFEIVVLCGQILRSNRVIFHG